MNGIVSIDHAIASSKPLACLPILTVSCAQAQAWNIDHLDTKQRENNWKTIRGIAAIMREFPDVVCSI